MINWSVSSPSLLYIYQKVYPAPSWISKPCQTGHRSQSISSLYWLSATNIIILTLFLGTYTWSSKTLHEVLSSYTTVWYLKMCRDVETLWLKTKIWPAWPTFCWPHAWLVKFTSCDRLFWIFTTRSTWCDQNGVASAFATKSRTVVCT